MRRVRWDDVVIAIAFVAIGILIAVFLGLREPLRGPIDDAGQSISNAPGT